MSKSDYIKKKIEKIDSVKLYEQLLLFKKELFNLRCQKKLGDLKNTSKFVKIKRDIAKIKTELVKRKEWRFSNA